MRLVLERRAERSTVIAITSPLIAIGLTLLTMTVLFALLGKNPFVALWVYFIDPLTDSYSLQEIAVKATPLVMIAIGLSFCYLANVWNIGAEGQFLIGAVAGSWLAVSTHGTDAGPWVMPAMLVLGALGGALYALIPAICKVRFGASEILTSLMLVYVADLFLDYLVRGPWRDPKGFNFPDHGRFRPGRDRADPDRRQPAASWRAHCACRRSDRDRAPWSHPQGFRNPRRRCGAQGSAVCRLQFQSARDFYLHGVGGTRRTCRHHRGRGPAGSTVKDVGLGVSGLAA